MRRLRPLLTLPRLLPKLLRRRLTLHRQRLMLLPLTLPARLQLRISRMLSPRLQRLSTLLQRLRLPQPLQRLLLTSQLRFLLTRVRLSQT